MVRYLPLIVKNSLRNRRRSTLTIASIGVSLCLLGLLFALYRAFFLGEASPAQALRLVTHHKVSLTQAMPVSYEQRIRQIPGVREVMTWQWFGGVYKDARDIRNMFARFAVDPQKFFLIRSEFQIPDDQKQAFLHERTGCVVGRALADRFGWKLGDRITLVGDIFPVTLELKIVGIYFDVDEGESLYFSQTYLREALPANRQDMVSAFHVLAENPQAVTRVATAIDTMFENSPAPTKTESEKGFQLSFISFLGNVKVFLLSICGAVTFTILLVSANTMAMSVRERVREVGILKTLGYNSEAILGIVLGEAALISLLGGVLGVGLASFLAAGVRQSATMFSALRTLTITPAVAGICLLVAVLIGVISSVIPAWNAARTTILDSLRFTG